MTREMQTPDEASGKKRRASSWHARRTLLVSGAAAAALIVADSQPSTADEVKAKRLPASKLKRGDLVIAPQGSVIRVAQKHRVARRIRLYYTDPATGSAIVLPTKTRDQTLPAHQQFVLLARGTAPNIIRQIEPPRSAPSGTSATKPAPETKPNASIAEDILSSQGGVLKSRGPVVFQFDASTGFPGISQHSEGDGTVHAVPSYGGQPRGLFCTGIGQELDGYGARDSGCPIFLRLDRFAEDKWITFSGRFSLTGTGPAAVDSVTIFIDTQAWDGSARAFPQIRYASTAPRLDSAGYGQWQLRTDNDTFEPIPDAFYQIGINENKYNSMYFALSFYLASSNPFKQEPFGQYGHFQIGARSFDLRSLNGGAAKESVQAGKGPFNGGLNVGLGSWNPTPGQWGGIIIERLELTVGDILA